MEINLSHKLRELRDAKGVSINDVAQYLGVRAGDIIDWEADKSQPPLSMVAELAGYYEVSTDALLGMENYSNEARIKEYLAKFQDELSHSRLSAAQGTIREALKHFPSNWKFKCMLLYVIYLSCDNALTTRQYTPEIEKICDDISQRCTIPEIRAEAIRILALHQHDNLGDTDAAIRTAMTLPRRPASRDDVLAAVTDGATRLLCLRKNAVDSLDSLIRTSQAICASLTDAAQKLSCCKSAADAAAAFYPDGDYGATAPKLFDTYAELVKLYCQAGDADGAVGAFSRLADIAVRYDADKTGAHTSPLAEGVRGGRPGASLTKRVTAELLASPVLAPIQYDKRVAEICERLAGK